MDESRRTDARILEGIEEVKQELQSIKELLLGKVERAGDMGLKGKVDSHDTTLALYGKVIWTIAAGIIGLVVHAFWGLIIGGR